MFPLCILLAVLLMSSQLSTTNVVAVNLNYYDSLDSKFRYHSLKDGLDYTDEFDNDNHDYPGRIVGGATADISQYPSAVQVTVREGDMLPGFGVCAGAILHSSWVLVAAHCIQGKEPRLVRVRAGASYFDQGGDMHAVIYLRIHEQFLETDTNIFFDVGLLKVVPDFNFYNPNIQPAVLPHDDGLGLKPGSIVTVVGWGRFEKFASNPNWPISDVLREVVNIVIPQEECPTSTIEPRHAFCTRSPDGVLRAGMKGDSGSPVYFENILVGIHSGGSDVTIIPQEDVINKHSSVTYFLSWAVNVMGIGKLKK